MKKKVGILTFHRAINYGGVLQCYCLYKTLENLGCEPYIIDYRPDYIEMYRTPFSKFELKKRKGLISKIIYLLGEVVKATKKKRNGQQFDIIFEGLNFYQLPKDNANRITGLDVILIGSDQVWCPRITNGIDPFFWGDFEHDNCIVATYAASMGRINKSLLKYEDQITRHIQNFDYISLREDYARVYINSLSDKQSLCVCDPTLLAHDQILGSIAVKPKYTDYVLYYALKEEPGMLDFANYVAKQLGTYVLKVKPNKKFDLTHSKEESVYGVTPQEFCGYLKHAKCVVCKSFHGTIISTIFKKDFYSFKSVEIDRAEAYLNSVGLADRAVNKSERPSISPVDYSKANIEISKIRDFSMSYLKEILSNG